MMLKKEKNFYVCFMCIVPKPATVDWMTTPDEDSALFT